MPADLYIAGTLPMVPSIKVEEWDTDFINPQKTGANKLLWTMDNFIYMRAYTEYSDDCIIEMFAVPTQKKCFPAAFWIQLYNECAAHQQTIRKHDKNLCTNAHPFILSGLFDWNGYTLIGHIGKTPFSLPETVVESFFQSPDWAILSLGMESTMPFVIRHTIPKTLLVKKRLHTSLSARSCFDVQVVASMRKELHIVDTADGVSFDALRVPKITESLTLYFILKPNEAIPWNLTITTKEEV